jgi:predicted ATPase/DNA-binding NarL/FixJ family response regulator
MGERSIGGQHSFVYSFPSLIERDRMISAHTNARHLHSLPPIPLGACIGRSSDLETIRSLLLEGPTRLLTIVGAGGVGKTRLAQEFAHAVKSVFDDGVWFVDVSQVKDAKQIHAVIAQSLGIKGDTAHVAEAITTFLRYQNALLVLDNLEQIAGAGLEVAGLLTNSVALKIIATSRQPLLVRGEQRYPLQALGLADPNSTLEIAQEATAVQLFIQRARTIRSDFRLNPQNLDAVRQLCAALDGLPLALELAAEHINTFPPSTLLSYWNAHHELPDARAYDRPARQRSLRVLSAWSYDLLPEAERGLFRQLGVFEGHFGIDAVEVVSTGHVTDALGALAGLADQHLISPQHIGTELRFCMSETMRAFAVVQLQETNELKAVQSRHAAYYTALAEEAAMHLHNAQGQTWTERLDREAANFNAALAWCFGGGDAPLGVRLCAALGAYWAIRGAFTDGMRWFEQALQCAQEPGSVRARLLLSAEHLAVTSGDVKRGATLAEEAAKILLFSDNPTECASGLNSLARAAWFRGAFDRAAEILERALELDRASVEGRPQLSALISLASVHLKRGALDRATALLNEALNMARAQGDRYATIPILCNLGWLSVRQGEPVQAVSLLIEGLALADSWSDDAYVAMFLKQLAQVATETDLHDLAVTLTVSAAMHNRTSPLHLESNTQLRALQAALSPEAFTEASNQGTRLSLPEIKSLCLSSFARAHSQMASLTEAPEIIELSPRELEVLHCVAAGENTKKIAILLGVSASTVRFHVESIFRKLFCHTRAEAVRVAVEHGLLGSIDSESLISK